MKDNGFCIRVRRDAVLFLEKMELLKEQCFDPSAHYANSVKEIARTGTQYEIIMEIWKTHSYDFLLNDESIFQFHKSDENLRYCFIQNPKVKITWKEFLYRNGLNEAEIAEEELEMYNSLYELGDDESCYEYIKSPIYLRYDLSKEQYQESFHPYSHLHVGLHNEIRFPISKILTPEMFAQLAVKMTYPELWRKKMAQNDILEFQKMVKKGCENVSKEMWSELDKCDLFFV